MTSVTLAKDPSRTAWWAISAPWRVSGVRGGQVGRELSLSRSVSCRDRDRVRGRLPALGRADVIDPLRLAAHHPVEVPAVGDTLQLVLAAVLHGPYSPQPLAASKLDVSRRLQTSDPARSRRTARGGFWRWGAPAGAPVQVHRRRRTKATPSGQRHDRMARSR